MTDSLSSIFKDGLFQTKKNPKRDWTQISDRAGQQLYGIVCEEFAHPEVALCALIHATAEVILCQTEKSKRDKLAKCLPDAILECVKRIEETESDEPYEFEGEEGEDLGEEEGEEGPPGKPGDPEQEEDEVDPSAEVDFKAHPMSGMAKNQPERPSPEPSEEDDDFPMEDDDPNESTFNDNPTKLAGFRPKKPVQPPPKDKRK